MAFKTGTQVDPRLMRADLSGFQRGAELQAAGIGAAIKGYQKGKKEKEEINFASEALLNSIKSNDYVRQAFGFTDAEAETLTANDLKPTIKGYGAKTALALSAQINLATTKAAAESGDKSRTRAKQFMDFMKSSGLEISKGQLRFIEAPKGKGKLGNKEITADEINQLPRVRELQSLFPEEFSAYFGEQFNLTPSAQPTGGMSFTEDQLDFSYTTD
jgi:hypothetical protein